MGRRKWNSSSTSLGTEHPRSAQPPSLNLGTTLLALSRYPFKTGLWPGSWAHFQASDSLAPSLQASGPEGNELSMAASATMSALRRQTKADNSMEAEIHRAIAQLAITDCPILIAGEVGTGKRSVARLIHAESNRSRGSFTEIRAAGCTEEQMLAALSARGTFYLSEIGELSAALQQLILEKYFQSRQVQKSRLLCGTTRELLDEVKSRRMHEEFFHRISAVTIRVTPLRLRKSEILTVTEELLTQYAQRFDRPKPVLGPEVITFLLNHPWPGNLVELQTAVKTLVAIENQSVTLAALRAAPPVAQIGPRSQPVSLKEAARAASIEVERQLIAEVLTATGGNRKRAADRLGISYKALLYKLKQVEPTVRSSVNGNGVAI